MKIRSLVLITLAASAAAPALEAQEFELTPFIGYRVGGSACGYPGCSIGFGGDVFWQGDFAAGVIIAF